MVGHAVEAAAGLSLPAEYGGMSNLVLLFASECSLLASLSGMLDRLRSVLAVLWSVACVFVTCPPPGLLRPTP